MAKDRAVKRCGQD